MMQRHLNTYIEVRYVIASNFSFVNGRKQLLQHTSVYQTHHLSKKLPSASSWPLVSFLEIPSSAKTASSSASSFFFNSFFESCLSVSLETSGWGGSLGAGSVDMGYSSSISSSPSSRRSSSLSLCCAAQTNINQIPWII